MRKRKTRCICPLNHRCLSLNYASGLWLCTLHFDRQTLSTHGFPEVVEEEGDEETANPEQDIKDGEEHVGGAGLLKEEGGGVQHRRARPPGGARERWA